MIFTGLPSLAIAKNVIRLATHATSGQVFQFLTADKEHLEEEGLEVHMVYINKTTDALAALGAGKIDVISTYGTGDILLQINNSQPFTMFGGYMIVGATPIFSRVETPYTGIKSFHGKKIAVMHNDTNKIILGTFCMMQVFIWIKTGPGKLWKPYGTAYATSAQRPLGMCFN